MRVTGLNLTNLRAIESAEFRFQPGLNLIVGVNGVGKSTVLDALRICMSRILPSITKSRTKAMSFSVGDIRSGFPFLDVELLFEHNKQEFRFTRRQWNQSFVADNTQNIDRLKREILNSNRLRDRARNLLRELDTSHGVADTDNFSPSHAVLKKSASESRICPNCIYFSTNRSIASSAIASKSKAAGEAAAAYAEALAPRPLYLAQFADWIRVQNALVTEHRTAARHVTVLRSAVRQFLPNYKDLRPDPKTKSRLVIDHSGVTLDASQLSDGERGVLALVLDIARRLSQANPSLADPLRDGEAIVLIDEIDLHLHPKWQRTIVEHLTGVFPRCQFIATTHSPQIVAAVEPEQIQLLTPDEVLHPDRSLGMDSNWILRHLMEADDRPESAAKAIQTAEGLIEKGSIKRARAAIKMAKDKGLDLPEWSVLEARIARFELTGK
jgi:predicted ATP-binding protein involved in virulence